MTRPSVALARLEDAVADRVRFARHALRRWPEIALEVALFLGICVEIALAVVRSAALYHGGP